MKKTHLPTNKIMDSVSIDCLLFGFNDGVLKILMVKHGEGISKGKWALPGGWINDTENIDDAASRLLYVLTGVSDIYLEQLRAFGEVNRFPTKRVITVAYFALIKPENYSLHPGFTASAAKWFDIQKVPKLPYDHKKIMEFGFGFLQHKVRHEPIGFNLLPQKFTLLELQELYEAILRKPLDKSNFRRKLMNMNLLVPCKEKQKDVSHRAALLYSFDKKIYDKLVKEEFNFEL